MKIGICSDHAGLDYKTRLISYLLGKGYDVVNFGTDSPDSCDYPDFAHPLAFAVENGNVDCGIAVCGTGNGMAISLNHHQGIRAGLAWNTSVARLVKEHNNANILVMPARFVSYNMCTSMARTWLNAEFAGGRHKRRIDKIPVDSANAVLNIIHSRRSIRHFTDEQVSADALQTVLEAGTWAPSAHGAQDNFILAVQDPAICDELRKLNAKVLCSDSDPYYGAPTIVLVFSKEANEKNYQKDGALVLGTMMLAAAGTGLGTCWINRCREMLELPEAAQLLSKLQIPEGYVGTGSLAVGYPAHIPQHPKARKEGYWKVL